MLRRMVNAACLVPFTLGALTAGPVPASIWVLLVLWAACNVEVRVGDRQ